MTDPGRSLIIIAHRLLIGTAICFGLFYATWEALAYRRTGDVSHLAIAALSAVITLAMGYYLKNLRRFVSRLR